MTLSNWDDTSSGLREASRSQMEEVNTSVNSFVFGGNKRDNEEQLF